MEEEALDEEESDEDVSEAGRSDLAVDTDAGFAVV